MKTNVHGRRRILITLALLAVTVSTAVAQTAPTVASVTPTPVTLEAGGSPVVVTLHGTDLERFTAAEVMLRGMPTSGISAALEAVSGPRLAARTVTITASDRASAGGLYTVQVSDDADGSPVEAMTFTVVAPPPVLASLALSATTATEGDPVTGTVRLGGPAPDGGVQVLLVSDHSGVTPRVASLVVPAGALTAPFDVDVTEAPAVNPVTLQASYDRVVKTATLSVQPQLRVASVELRTSSVLEGERVVATLRLNTRAPAGGATVTIQSNDPNVMPEATTVFIPEAQSVAWVGIVATGVPNANPVAVIAQLGNHLTSERLTVIPLPVLSSIGTGSYGIQRLVWLGIDETVTATVQMRRSIPEGAGTSHVTLRSSHPAVHPAATRVLIREGEQSADITLRALGLPENNPVTITATYRGVEETMAVIVPKLKSLSLPSRVGVGETISGEVRLDYPAPSGGIRIHLLIGGDLNRLLGGNRLITFQAGTFVRQFEIEGPRVAPESSYSVTVTARQRSLMLTRTLDVHDGEH